MPDFTHLHQWPVDETDMPQVAIEVAHNRGLPFSPTEPLLFHVLTSLPPHSDLARDLIEEGAVLLPRVDIAAEAGRVWDVGAKSGLIFARDMAAGDDRYIFTTPSHPFSHYDGRTMPAVAFSARHVARLAPLAFRPIDFEAPYARIESAVDVSENAYDAYSVEEWDSMTEEARTRALEAANADAVAPALEFIAECGTQTDQAKVMGLIRLYHDMLQSPEPAVFHDAAQPLRPVLCELEDDDVAFDMGAMPNDVRYALQQIAGAWRDLFATTQSFPHSFFSRDRAARPEVLIDGGLMLAEALFYRDEQRQWLPVTDEMRQRAWAQFEATGGLGIVAGHAR